MSRSYKKTPWAGDTSFKKRGKQLANAKVRAFLKNLDDELTLNGSKYKQVFETWNISDYGWIEDWEQYWVWVKKRYAEHPELYKNPPNEKEEYRKWYKMYKMK